MRTPSSASSVEAEGGLGCGIGVPAGAAAVEEEPLEGCPLPAVVVRTPPGETSMRLPSPCITMRPGWPTARSSDADAEDGDIEEGDAEDACASL
jgi:hypothetical protein